MATSLALISLSTGWLPRLENRPYYELSSVLTVMDKFWRKGLVDGFEFGLLPEWDSENSPLTPCDAPSTCEKHSYQEILQILEKRDFKLLTVHASRDVGCYLCSDEQMKRSKGVKLVDDSLRFCHSSRSKICTFHFWNPWGTSIDREFLREVYGQAEKRFPGLEISVENIPTVIKDETPFNLMRDFDYTSLDLKWASMYDEFDKFLGAIEKVDNLHIQGKYHAGNLVCTAGNLDFDAALREIVDSGFSGVFTVELEGRASYLEMKAYIRKLRKVIR